MVCQPPGREGAHNGWVVCGRRERKRGYVSPDGSWPEEETSLGGGCGEGESPVDPVTHARDLGLDPEGTSDSNRVPSGTGQSKKPRI